jgi:hypothetical protein
MHYMPADSEQTAAAVSGAIYHLTRNHAHGDPADTDVTQYAFGRRQAADGSWWMQWDGDMVLPIHPEHFDDLAQILAGFVAAGQLQQASADAVMSIAADRAGSTVTLAEVTPPEWSALMLTDEQAAPMWPATETV